MDPEQGFVEATTEELPKISLWTYASYFEKHKSLINLHEPNKRYVYTFLTILIILLTLSNLI